MTIRLKTKKYDINREAVKISALSSGKIHKYEYLTGQEMLASDQSRMIEQVYLFSFKKSFWKQLKATEDEERKHVKTLLSFKTW